jgi:hypothetical protein
MVRLMAFTLVEQDRILGLLGLPSSVDQFSYLGRVDLPAAAETRIRSYLEQLDLIDALLVVHRAEGPLPYLQLLSEAQRFVRLISLALDLSIHYDVYGISDVCGDFPTAMR